MSKKFILIAQPRSGSTAIRMHLDKSNEVLCHGEILVDNNQYRFSMKTPKIKRFFAFYTKMKIFNVKKFHDIVFPNKYSYEGLKVLTNHFLDKNNLYLLNKIIDDKIKIFFLIRENLLEQVISSIIYESSKRPLYKNKLFINEDYILNRIHAEIISIKLTYNTFLKNKNFSVSHINNLTSFEKFFKNVDFKNLTKVNENDYKNDSKKLFMKLRKITELKKFEKFKKLTFQQIINF